MPFEARFVNNDPKTAKHTAAADIDAGEVVLIGNTTGLTCGVAHQPIANAAVGTLAVGGGTYEVVNLDNAANGAKVWWDNTNNKVTTTSTNNALFGFIVADGAGGANTNCYALHEPYV
jgi:predicted RecA/RadA family phage recombinase